MGNVVVILEFPGISFSIPHLSFSLLYDPPPLPLRQCSLAPWHSLNRWGMFGIALQHGVRLNWAWRTSYPHAYIHTCIHHSYIPNLTLLISSLFLTLFPPSLKEPVVPLVIPQGELLVPGLQSVNPAAGFSPGLIVLLAASPLSSPQTLITATTHTNATDMQTYLPNFTRLFQPLAASPPHSALSPTLHRNFTFSSFFLFLFLFLSISFWLYPSSALCAPLSLNVFKPTEEGASSMLLLFKDTQRCELSSCDSAVFVCFHDFQWSVSPYLCPCNYKHISLYIYFFISPPSWANIWYYPWKSPLLCLLSLSHSGMLFSASAGSE